MSQEKVDRRKYEKYNRKKLEKQRKLKFTIKCIVAALVIGAIIGVPMGINYYRSIPKFVGDSTLKAFVGNYIDDSHASDVPAFTTTEEETTEDEAVKAVEDALGSQVEKVDSDNVDEVLGNDDSTAEADSDGDSEE